jgi:hypothetical protein
MATATLSTGASARLADTPTMTLAARVHVRATIADLDGDALNAQSDYELAAALYHKAGDAEMAAQCARSAAEALTCEAPALPVAA